MQIKTEKTEQQWREELTPAQYRVMREKGTEPAFTGAYVNEKSPGIYHCAACGVHLFDSDAKYDSGSGWPSFWDVISSGNVETIEDRSLGMTRTEVRCAQCEAHLGHVYPDGPQPTGLRYCVNSAALKLKKRLEEAEQADLQNTAE
jgi:peptide-methionine (R)-S-oxide reductase